ncbi:MAG TPA: cyclic nucleotide-binding domain-containing protein, partial [Trichocoleus sp.]
MTVANMTVSNIMTWLQERTPLGLLSQSSLRALALELEERNLAAGETLIAAGAPADGLYILLSGQIETQGSTAGDVGFLPGSVLNLEALLLNQSVEKTLVTLTPAQTWFISSERLQALINQHSDILQT